MMDQCSLDPYEEQLFKVFDSHDLDNIGSLDIAGLRQLCDTLQLQDKSDDLITALLNERNRTRATFSQFKDALLQLLGTMQSNRTDVEKERDSDREVAPKYVVGSKKYGRRSRPRIDDSPISPNNNATVQRSNSTAEHIRKPLPLPLRLQRCTSVPTVPSYTNYDETSFISSSMTDVCTEDMLREAWRKLGVGEDGFLNQNELILVCEAIGLNKLADSVIRYLSNKSVLEYTSNKKISFQELLEALQKDDTWSEFLGEPQLNSKENFILNSDDGHHSKANIKLGPDGSGFISQEMIVEMWENAGIASPKVLLKDLGFKPNASIDVQELARILEKEIKSLSELRIDHTCNPLVALLQAFITMYQAEIKCLKSILQQMCDEKEKLKFDVSEANNRSTLLAQEVDENVLKMEQKAERQVKAMEHRHSEIMRELAEQYTNEKEQILVGNQELEIKIKTLENEESLLRDNLQSVQTYLGVVENENKELTSKIFELEQTNVNLEKHIDCLELEKLKVIESESLKSDELLDKIGTLQRENCVLKDKNDEMISQIESLNKEMQILSLKPKSPNMYSDDALINIDGIGLGAKRRNGEPPNDELDEFESARSPRLGKMRKFHESKDTLDTSYTLSDNCDNDDNERIGTDLLLNDTNEHVLLHRKMLLVENLLNKYAIELDLNEDLRRNNIKSYTNKLELLLGHLLTKVNDENASEFHSELMTHITTDKTRTNQDDNDCNDRLTNVHELEEANRILTEKCEDLQQGLNLLRDEYELCEDYWQKKLEDERCIYELEQSQSTDKLNEVLTRLTEYEEQFLCESKRLGTIDESGNLEKQYTDLESEYEDYKDRTLVELDDKDVLIATLKDQLEHTMHLTTSDVRDVGVQASDMKCMVNLSNHLIETTNLYPHDTEPSSPSTNWPKLNNHSVHHQPVSAITLPSTSNDQEPNSNTAMPLKTKKNRRHVRSLTHPTRMQKRMNGQPDGDSTSSSESPTPKNGKHTVKMTNHEVQTLVEKQLWLEQRYKELQHELKNQKRLYEQLSKSYCRLYYSCRGELQHAHAKLDQQFRVSTKLHEKLAENDVLVGNLYIENAYLIKTNQRLEQQLNMFTNPSAQVNVNF